MIGKEEFFQIHNSESENSNSKSFVPNKRHHFIK